VNPEGVFIALKMGETTLAFVDAGWVACNGIDFAPVSPQAQPLGIEISFWVEDVEATYRAAIEAGASAWYGPVAKRWGKRSHACAIRTASWSRSRAHRQRADPVRKKGQPVVYNKTVIAAFPLHSVQRSLGNDPRQWSRRSWIAFLGGLGLLAAGLTS